MSFSLLSSTPGAKHLLLGNEAIVRGALEAGVGVVTCYPGTPSSEVPDTFYKLADKGDFYFEHSANEKVALEVGGGAAIGGIPTLVTMKHVGLNVAADPLLTLAYIGTPGGLVVLSADDPGCHSSQNEQDNRYYAKFAGIPCFEPATAQEAKNMTKEALKLSSKWEQPVLLRTTTRINHMRGTVEFGSIEPIEKKDFKKDPNRFVPLPAIARVRHNVLWGNLTKLQKESEQSPFNFSNGQSQIGIIASGISRAYLHDVLQELELQNRFKVLELGFSYPFPEQKVLDFLQGIQEVLVIEELEPILEESVRVLCQKKGLEIKVWGKDEYLTRQGEYSTSLIAQSISSLLNTSKSYKKNICAQGKNLPKRPPNLCAGCSHRALYYAVRKVFAEEAVYSSDIGCYTLGFLSPLRTADFFICMGSSISGGTGMSRATDQPVIAFIGDSTFFHSGLTGLVNAVYNQHNILIIILDNKTTAMTGHQPHPGVDQTRYGPNPSKVDIETIVKGCGVEHVRKVKPFNHKATLNALQEFKELSGVRVIIAEEPCVLYARKVLGKSKSQVAYVTENHPEVRTCLEELACPAFYVQDGAVFIDENQCTGCMLCVQICDYFKAKKRS